MQITCKFQPFNDPRTFLFPSHNRPQEPIAPPGRWKRVASFVKILPIRRECGKCSPSNDYARPIRKCLLSSRLQTRHDSLVVPSLSRARHPTFRTSTYPRSRSVGFGLGFGRAKPRVCGFAVGAPE